MSSFTTYSWRRTLRVTLGCWLMMWLVGCNDLLDSNYPLIPTPQGNVVAEAEGREDDNWEIEKGKFHVERQLVPDVFLQVNQERVQGLIDQAFAKDKSNTTQDSDAAWSQAVNEMGEDLDENLRLAVEAWLHPEKALPSRVVTLTHNGMPHKAKAGTVSALNKNGSRLLLVEDKLMLWDTRSGELLKELPCPAEKIKFAFLTTAGDEAILFAARSGYRFSLSGGEPNAVNLGKQEIKQVVASDDRDQFFVQQGNQTVRFNSELSPIPHTSSTPVWQLNPGGIVAMSRNADALATYDSGSYVIKGSNDNRESFIGGGSSTDVRNIILLPRSRLLSVTPKEVQQVWSADQSRFSFNTVGCVTALNIVHTATSSLAHDTSPTWLTVCVERLDAKELPLECLVYDINIHDRLASLPTTIGDKQPDRLEFSGDGRVVLPIEVGEPVKLHWRGPRVVQYATVDTIVQCLADLILDGSQQQAERLLDRLEEFAASLPYNLRTRELLDLKSLVARRLAKLTAKREVGLTPTGFGSPRSEAPKESTDDLRVVLSGGSTLAKLVRAAQLANYHFTSDVAAWNANRDEVGRLVQEILATDKPPLLAYEIWTVLSWPSMEETALSSQFVAQFERDPLNPSLHVCMASYYSPTKAGDLGMSGAYLKKFCEYLPSEERDAAYCLNALTMTQWLAPREDVRMLSSDLKPIYDQSSPYAAVITGQSSPSGNTYVSLGMNLSRVARGLNQLLQPSSAWEFPASLWPELQRAMPTDVMTNSDKLVEEHLRRNPFTFSDEFTNWFRGNFETKRAAGSRK